MLSCAAVKRWLVVLVLVGLTGAACGADVDDSGPTTTKPQRTTTTTNPDEAAVRRVAEEWHAAALRLAANPDPADPALRRYLTGDLLGRYEADLARRAKDGLVVRAPPDSVAKYTIEEVRVTGDSATLRECSIDDLLLVSKKSGEVLDDEVVTSELETVAKKVNGDWRLARRMTRREWKGVARCGG